VFRLPPAYVFMEWLGMGATGVWYAIALSNVLAMLATALWFLRGTWADSVIDDAPDTIATGDD
jgi:Na+-driven multidrug efflux pump